MILLAQPFRLHIIIAGSKEELDQQIKSMDALGWASTGEVAIRQTVHGKTYATVLINVVPDSRPRKIA